MLGFLVLPPEKKVTNMETATRDSVFPHQFLPSKKKKRNQALTLGQKGEIEKQP